HALGARLPIARGVRNPTRSARGLDLTNLVVQPAGFTPLVTFFLSPQKESYPPAGRDRRSAGTAMKAQQGREPTCRAQMARPAVTFRVEAGNNLVRLHI